MAAELGKQLSRQSDRDFPPTNFGYISKSNRLMGKKYRGVMLILACILRSTKGRNILKRKRRFGGKNGVKDWSMVVELVMEWEAYLCEPKMRRETLVKMKRKHRVIMKYILKVCPTTTGNQMKFFKFHVILHLVADILLYGLPMEVGTGPNESHHKPSKHVSVGC